jgi:hypothetical protein
VNSTTSPKTLCMRPPNDCGVPGLPLTLTLPWRKPSPHGPTLPPTQCVWVRPSRSASRAVAEDWTLLRGNAMTLACASCSKMVKRFFVQLIVEGAPLITPKNTAGTGTVGVDLGPSTIALVPHEHGDSAGSLQCVALVRDRSTPTHFPPQGRSGKQMAKDGDVLVGCPGGATTTCE